MSSRGTPMPGTGQGKQSKRLRRRLGQTLIGVGVATALAAGQLAAAPAAQAADPNASLGAPGHTAPGAVVYVPGPVVNTTPTGGPPVKPFTPRPPSGNRADTNRPLAEVSPIGPGQGTGPGPIAAGSPITATAPGAPAPAAPGAPAPAAPAPTAPTTPSRFTAQQNNAVAPAVSAGVVASQAPSNPGLGVQKYYPIERRPLGDRMELDINTANGNVVLRYRDLSFSGLGENTSIEHVYNNESTSGGAFGSGWTMSTGADVGLDLSDPNNVIYVGPTGFQWKFVKNSSGYTTPSSANSKLAKNSDGTYTLTNNDTKEKQNFSSGGTLTSQVDKNNNKLTFNYNADGSLNCITDARGAVTTMTGYTNGNLTSFKDPTGANYGPYTYDANDHLTGFTDRGGKQVSYGYDAAGNLTSITDPAGNQYTLGYDANTRVTSLTEPTANNQTATTTFDYSTAGQTKETDANNHATTYFFDSDGKQTKATDGLGHNQGKTYTANFDVATTTDGMGNSVTASYDAANNLIGTQLPTGAKSAIGYTDSANPNAPTTSTDKQGNQFSATYDAKGNPLTAKSVTANITDINRTYNSNGTVKDSTDGAGNKTTYTYDTQGRLTTVTPPLPRKPISYTYDSLSRITSVTDGNGQEIDYSYDAFDRVTQVSKKNADSSTTALQQTTFDANGNRTANYFGSTTTTNTFNPRGEVLTGSKQSGILGADNTSYTYDKVGNLASYQDAGGTVGYQYDAANNLTKLTDPTNAITTFQYDNGNHRTSTTFPNQTNIQTGYDKSGRIVSQAFNGPSSQFFNNTYSYTKAANSSDSGMLQSERNAQYQTLNFTYDGENRLTKAAIAAGGSYDYAYDAAGNLTSYEGTPYTNNTAEQLTKVGGTTLNYDNQGNQTGDSAGRAMTYSPTNQVTHTSDPGTGAGTGTTDYSYTSVDQTQRDRVTTKAGGALTANTTDLTQSALGITGLTQNGTARTTVWRDPDGRMLGYKDPQGGVHYTATDFQNTTLGSSSSGALDAKYQYAPYGRVVGAQGSAAGANSFTYAGDLRLGNDHQNLNGARTYDAINGRFTQPDPIGTPGSAGDGKDNGSTNGISGPYSHDGNPYLYVGDSPMTNTDPTGLAPPCTGALVNGAISTLGDVGLGAAAGAGGGALFAGVGAGPGLAIGALAGGINGALKTSSAVILCLNGVQS